jgi:hypothetical protein
MIFSNWLDFKRLQIIDCGPKRGSNNLRELFILPGTQVPFHHRQQVPSINNAIGILIKNLKRLQQFSILFGVIFFRHQKVNQRQTVLKGHLVLVLFLAIFQVRIVVVEIVQEQIVIEPDGGEIGLDSLG